MPIAPHTSSRFDSASANQLLPTSSRRSPSPTPPSSVFEPPSPSKDRWKPSMSSGNGHARRHSRSISDVLKHSRARARSVTAHEVADALKAPISVKLIILCVIWYLASALSNTSSKAILIAFPKPVTLTIIQFAFVSSWCIFLLFLAQVWPALRKAVPGLQGGLRSPSRHVIATTAPLAIFQVGGHIASSIATEKIAVSLVHTIKGMSPLFTVFAYRFLFGIRYSWATYVSLIPLTLGVMLACSVEFRGNLFGILMAFAGALIFVSQNIFSKRLFNESNFANSDLAVPIHKRKLDKLNLLCYSAGMAFLLTCPLWLYSEGFLLLGEYIREGKIELSGKTGKHGEVPLSGLALIGEFIFNGTVHFSQNILAFVLLSMVSPVTYSVASLVKRIFVICMAIVWFKSTTTTIQSCGIALTFLGLYLYDRAGDASKKERIVRADQLKNEHLLPLNRLDTSGIRRGSDPHGLLSGHVVESPMNVGSLLPPLDEGKEKADTPLNAPNGGNSWLPPGTRQEETWRPREMTIEG